MINTAIEETAVRHIKNIIDDAERGPLSLYRRCKTRAVIYSSLAHVDWPARIDRAGIQIKRKDEMLLGFAAIWRGHCIEKKRSRTEIDDRGAGDANGINVPWAHEIR